MKKDMTLAEMIFKNRFLMSGTICEVYGSFIKKTSREGRYTFVYTFNDDSVIHENIKPRLKVIKGTP